MGDKKERAFERYVKVLQPNYTYSMSELQSVLCRELKSNYQPRSAAAIVQVMKWAASRGRVIVTRPVGGNYALYRIKEESQ